MPDHPMRESIGLMDGHWYQSVPTADYAWMRDEAPVYRDPTTGLWGVTRYEDVMAISKDPALFCSGEGSRPDSNSPSMINMDDPEHKRRRKLVNKGFTPRQLAAHEIKIREICRDLIGRVSEKGECEFVREVAAPLPMIMIGDMLGVEPEDRDTLLKWSDDMLIGTGGSTDPESLRAVQEAGEGWRDYVARVMVDRRANPRDDLISILMHSEVDGRGLSDEEIQQESLLILIGGDETTRHVITEGMATLIRHPDERQKLIDDPGKLTVAVEELLRWVSPIKNMNRTATRDTELRGQPIREGDKILLLYHAANFDERAYETPETLDVERHPNQHVAFGGYGTHHCLGASLARLELRIMFEELLANLPDIELATDGPLPMRQNNFIVGIEEMDIRFTPRRLG